MRLLLLCLSLLTTLSLTAQRSAFAFFSPSPEVRQSLPEGDYRALHLDVAAVSDHLADAPEEFGPDKRGVSLELPLPDGTFLTYRAFSASVFENKLNFQYPSIRSYAIYGEHGMGRVAISPRGLVAFVRGPEGYITIEPLEDMPGEYAIYSSRDFAGFLGEDRPPLSCGFDDGSLSDLSDIELGEDAGARLMDKQSGQPLDLREYDLVMTNTGEFAERLAGNDEPDSTLVMGAFNEAVNVVNAIFQNEIGARMRLLDISGALIYLNPNNDPFSMADEGSALLSQVITAFTQNNVPFESYDLGHIFTARCNDVGGVVSGLACTPGKTRGVTCVGGSVTGAARRIMAHEIAHQFAVSHSWNNCPGSQEQRASQTAFEPGSGSTIMSYSGACGSQNNIGADDAYYHVGSLVQFLRYTREGGASDCATIMETDNIQPEIILDYEDGFFIPVSTPFVLTGSAVDENEDDVLTFNWEQYDLGPAVRLGQPAGNTPLFRSVRPTIDGATRYFPELSDITRERVDVTEMLPDYARDMTFRLTARDNHAPAGAAVWEQVAFKTTDQAGPFLVNNPDLTGGPWEVGQYREVTWDVAGTDQSPVNARSVDIFLSDDGGFTFESGVTLAENVANTGSAFVTVPDVIGDDMIIMVKAHDNVFFNLNQDPFSIRAGTEPAVIVEATQRYVNVCLPAELAIDIDVEGIRGYDGEVSLSIEESSLPEGADVAFTNPTLRPGESAILYVNVRPVTENGFVTLQLNVAAEGLPNTTRDIVLDLTSNNYQDLMLVSPEEGAAINLQAPFDWTPSPAADNYDLEIATSAGFEEETIFGARYGLTETGFTFEDFFDPNTLYFWRVRGNNECGPGPWRDVRSFRTANLVCNEYESTGGTVNLPGQGPAFSRSFELFVDASGTISDVNIPQMDLRYQVVSQVKLTLRSPAGTSVVLYDQNCFSTGILNLGFDDEAPAEVVCPPDDNRVAQPVGNLSDFDGENTLGGWTLILQVRETGGAAGRFNGWTIEFCADGASQAITVGNIGETMVDQLASATVESADLSVSSNGVSAADILYTVTRTPLGGRITLGGGQLRAGDTFTQADVDGGRLEYTNTDAGLETDGFGFVVTTPDGGYLPVNYHRFVISDIGVSTQDEEFAASLEVFPNPTGNDLFLRWNGVTGRPNVEIELYGMTGQRLLQRSVLTSARGSQLDLAALPSGIYLLRVDGTVRRIVKQ